MKQSMIIDEDYIKKISKLADEMEELGDSLVEEDYLSLVAFQFILSWWKCRKFEEKDGKKYIKQ